MQLTNVVLLAIATLLTACSTTTPRRFWSSSDVSHADERLERGNAPRHG
jgi:outer membrane biogenesis lipoprotein LolB